MSSRASIKETPVERFIRQRLRRSHKRQFEGEDWQTVAVDLTEDVPEDIREEVFEALSGSPSLGCECGFCETAPWRLD